MVTNCAVVVCFLAKVTLHGECETSFILEIDQLNEVRLVKLNVVIIDHELLVYQVRLQGKV